MLSFYCCLLLIRFSLFFLFIRQEEADSLRSRVTALEKERADLKYIADRLETKVIQQTPPNKPITGPWLLATI